MSAIDIRSGVSAGIFFCSATASSARWCSGWSVRFAVGKAEFHSLVKSTPRTLKPTWANVRSEMFDAIAKKDSRARFSSCFSAVIAIFVTFEETFFFVKTLSSI